MRPGPPVGEFSSRGRAAPVIAVGGHRPHVRGPRPRLPLRLPRDCWSTAWGTPALQGPQVPRMSTPCLGAACLLVIHLRPNYRKDSTRGDCRSTRMGRPLLRRSRRVQRLAAEAPRDGQAPRLPSALGAARPIHADHRPSSPVRCLRLVYGPGADPRFVRGSQGRVADLPRYK